MNLSRIFIERPVATTVLVAAIVIFGLFAFRALPVSELPSVDFPTPRMPINAMRCAFLSPSNSRSRISARRSGVCRLRNSTIIVSSG